MVESVFREAYIFQPATKWTVRNVPWQWFTFIPFDINSYQKKKKKKKKGTKEKKFLLELNSAEIQNKFRPLADHRSEEKKKKKKKKKKCWK